MCVRVFLIGQKGRGVIDREDLGAVCLEYGVRAGEAVLDDLMSTCDADRDGVLDFLEFANFLNWKQKMPISHAEQRVLTGRFDVSLLFYYQGVRASLKSLKSLKFMFLNSRP